MATSAPSTSTAKAAVSPRSAIVRKTVAAVVLVIVLQSALAFCLVSAAQLLVPRNMPFGEVGSSPVVDGVQNITIGGTAISFNIISYASEADALQAIDRSQIYGAYVTGTSSDTLLSVPAKSFFALTEIVPLFEQAAKKAGRQLEVRPVKPLPAYDPVGSVVGLLMLPTLVGGLLAGLLLLKATAPMPFVRRGAILLGYALFGALVTDLVAGPVLGAVSMAYFVPLLLCFTLVTAAVALSTAALAGLGQAGALLALVIYVVLGLCSSGGSGSALLPIFWQRLGSVLPPRFAVDLYRNVIYFDGNSIVTPIIGLVIWAVAGAAGLAYFARKVRARVAPAGGARSPQKAMARIILVMLALAALDQFLFSINYTSSGHEPAALKLPFGVTGPSSLVSAVQQKMSLDVKTYADENAAKQAIDNAEIWGALIPASSNSATNTLIFVPSASALAPLDLQVKFQEAAKAQQATLIAQSYTPVALPPGDPFGLVPGLMLTPILIGGYLVASQLRNATGVSAARYRGLILVAYAVVAGLCVALIAGPLLGGLPPSGWLIAWPILALATLVVAGVASVLGTWLGSAGTFVTVIIIILFGNPSTGGANGTYYLPAFWNTLGPFLPPRNALTLVHNALYFNGHGTTQAVLILLAYLVVFGVIIGVLDWHRVSAPDVGVDADTEFAAAAASTATPAGVV